jgi:Ni/Co efflux regulator RcnB
MMKILMILATTVAMLAGPTFLVHADDDDARETRKAWEEQRREARKDREESQREARKTREEREREARKDSRDDDDDDD